MEKEPSNGADGYSASAIGHRGLIKLLRKLDIPVVVSQGESAKKAKDGLLVIAEPMVTDEASARRLRDMVREARRVLVILPKWWTSESAYRKEWVVVRRPDPDEDVAAVLAELHLRDASSTARSRRSRR